MARFSARITAVKRGTITVCLLYVLVLLSSTLDARDTVTFDQSNPPFMYAVNGTLQGLYPAIIDEAFRRMGKEVSLQALPWQRALAGADEGVWGVGGLYMNEERLWKYDFSEPIFEEKLMLYVVRGGEFHFSRVADLKGKRVGVMRGWTYGDAFDQAVAEGVFKKDPASDDRINFNRLLMGRVDAVIAAPETWALIRKDVDPDGWILELAVPMAVNRTYLSFPKSRNMTEILQRFNVEIRRMQADGAMEALVREHLR